MENCVRKKGTLKTDRCKLTMSKSVEIRTNSQTTGKVRTSLPIESNQKEQSNSNTF